MIEAGNWRTCCSNMVISLIILIIAIIIITAAITRIIIVAHYVKHEEITEVESQNRQVVELS